MRQYFMRPSTVCFTEQHVGEDNNENFVFEFDDSNMGRAYSKKRSDSRTIPEAVANS